ncbi:MAG TPA: helix-turn-helix domain-containing protein [Devosia sp.]|jgi:DNA-binding HxlR family transcriptional regulator|uniref:winged helix-turn-helix transcriptional regulator n=1 Tax=Devosia sp. TaxID=1871048 RepID=UPI002DDDA408|nr:helix-turn-helix domain-containing protein [Devosia sp.]HEV2517597.1 helix-turn-helix domain-containing protein [Devosia sp.]
MQAPQPFSCGLGPAFDVIGGKWKGLILWRVHTAPRRFGELRRLIPGISEKVLSECLREMEVAGLVQREIFPEVPPRVEYSATALGVELDIALAPLAKWGERYAALQSADVPA